MNDKVFYRFVEFLGKLNGYDVVHERFKLISLNKISSDTNTEKKVKRIADSFRYLVNSTSQVIDKETFETSYYLLTKNNLAKELSETLVSIYHKRKDSIAHKVGLLLHNEILSSDIILKEEYAIIIASFVLVLNNYSPIIIYDSEKEKYFQANKERNDSTLYNLFIELEHQTRIGIGNEINVKFETSLEEILKIIKENKIFLQTDFFVEHMYLYGSIVKNSTTLTSDVDFLVVLKKELLMFERNELIKKCKEFLESKIKASVDIMEFDYVLQQLEMSEANRSRQLF
ncbi:MAG: nucleotidyltransferase domain-containing protein [Acholeplasmatales bacterium]|jgi:predicted nucleotidyltransferase|nr:nucleotidyltransferase domain-containing protein [Acholeplasmatales bacterium]